MIFVEQQIGLKPFGLGSHNRLTQHIGFNIIFTFHNLFQQPLSISQVALFTFSLQALN